MPNSKLFDTLHKYSDWSIGLCLAVISVLASKDKVINLIGTDLVAGLLVCLLIVSTLAWYFRYMSVSRNELLLLDEAYQADRIQGPRGAVLPIAVIVGLCFAGLIAFSTDPLSYSALASVLCVADFWGSLTLSRTLNDLYPNKKFKAGSEEKAAILFQYYNLSPHLLRHMLLMLTFVIVLMVSILASARTIPGFSYIVYPVMILAPWVHEAVLVFWRRPRDEKLAALATVVGDDA